MDLREKQKIASKKRIVQACKEGDIITIMAEGLRSFERGFDEFLANILESGCSFQKFLTYTGRLFDQLIMKSVKEEGLSFVGGTLLFRMQNKTTIELEAKLYFQRLDQKWVLKEKKGKMEVSNFNDWGTAPLLLQLQKDGQIELPIEPPEMPSDEG